MRLYKEPFYLPDDVIEKIIENDNSFHFSYDFHKRRNSEEVDLDIIVDFDIVAEKYKHENNKFVILLIKNSKGETLFSLFLPFLNQKPWAYEFPKDKVRPNKIVRPFFTELTEEFEEDIKKMAFDNIRKLSSNVIRNYIFSEGYRVRNFSNVEASLLELYELVKESKGEINYNISIGSANGWHRGYPIDISSPYIKTKDKHFSELIEELLKENTIIFDPLDVLNVKVV